jgi:hypothetical protein
MLRAVLVMVRVKLGIDLRLSHARSIQAMIDRRMIGSA